MEKVMGSRNYCHNSRIEHSLVLMLLSTTLFVTLVNATHFRGGTVFWKPSPSFSEDVKEIIVEYWIGWRQSYFLSQCTDNDINNQTLYEGVDSWETAGGAISRAEYVCVEYDLVNDWMIGYNRFYYNVTSENLIIRYQGRCWISGLFQNACGWSLSIGVDVAIRSDIRRPNSSPRSTSAPVINMQVGCPVRIKIPTTDPDDDVVKCRIGENYDECGEICENYKFFTITEDCYLEYNGGGTVTIVAVGLVIEDFPKENIVLDYGNESIEVTPEEALSYSTLQFLVHMEKSEKPCNAKPSFLEGTPPDGQEIMTTTGTTFSFSVYVEPSEPSETIKEVVFLYPFGASKSSIELVKNSTYKIDVAWNPSSEQTGNHLFCFTAHDSADISSDQRCLLAVVGGASSPCFINNGGCSDKCVFSSGSSYYCTCPRTCWYLDVDGRTCRPNIEVTCLSDHMDITVPTCAVDDSFLTLGSSAPSSRSVPEECRVIDEGEVYNFSMLYDQCQVQIMETFWEIRYINTVRLWANAGVDEETQDPDSVITRGAWYYVPVSCTFSKFGNLTASFQPIDRQIQLYEIPGMGSFSFMFDFYNSSNFEQAISPYDYPLSFTVNSDIFFGIRAVGGTSNMQIFTVSCTALPNSFSSDSSPSYSMISNGCVRDTTMAQYESPSKMENRFSIKAFKFRESFPSTDGPTVVNIQCSVVVCQDTDDITRCSQGCTDGVITRRKRDASLIYRRYKRQADDDDDDDDDDESFNSSSLNVTETPIQEVASTGNIQIVLDVAVNPTPSDPSIEDSTLRIEIVLACGIAGVAVVLLLIICSIMIYHNKIVKQRNLIFPIQNPSTAAYVRDIYIPNIDLGYTHAHGDGISIKNPTKEYLWARRVISGPPDNVLRISKNEW